MGDDMAAFGFLASNEEKLNLKQALDLKNKVVVEVKMEIFKKKEKKKQGYQSYGHGREELLFL